MIDPSIAHDAINLVDGDRQRNYGTPESNLGSIAGMWSAYLGVEVTAADVAKMMVMMKLSRSRTSKMRDHYVDGIGYLLLAEALHGE